MSPSTLHMSNATLPMKIFFFFFFFSLLARGRVVTKHITHVECHPPHEDFFFFFFFFFLTGEGRSCHQAHYTCRMPPSPMKIFFFFKGEGVEIFYMVRTWDSTRLWHGTLYMVRTRDSNTALARHSLHGSCTGFQHGSGTTQHFFTWLWAHLEHAHI